jgi:hypothetical protein
LGTAIASAQEDPASVILRFQDARNRIDVESAMTFVAPDLVYIGGATCPAESPCAGTDAFRRDIDQFSADQEYSSSAASLDVSGTTVQVRIALQSPGRSAIGLDRNLTKVLAQLLGGGSPPEPVAVVRRMNRQIWIKGEYRWRVRPMQRIGRFQQSECVNIASAVI